MNITENNMADASIIDLKKIILSLNEKITDNQIDNFQKLVSQLEKQFKKNETIIIFLKMMQSLGKYLGLKKNNAHADSMQVLNSITAGLEKIF
ncbi:MAG: hypothetical protein U9N77_06145, partial [Thermodesulfobacteriota bacterium]|nr:hypothetical protein [Thermodesulfobacteriota bacterium]